MENPLFHLLHASILCVLLYLFMRYFLHFSQIMSLNRSLLVSSIVLIYMILFGHRLPFNVNRI